MRTLILIILSNLAFLTNAQNFEAVPNAINTDIKVLFNDSLDNLLYFGGVFGLNGTDTVRGVATWDGSVINAVGEGMMNFQGGSTCGVAIQEITQFQNKVYVSGNGTWFTVGDSIWTRGIGVWDGVQWDSIHVGLIDDWGQPSGLNVFEVINNELYVGGGFTSINGTSEANGIAKFDGVNWSPVFNFPQWGQANGNIVRSIAEYNGEIYVAGVLYDHYPYDTMMNICRYNGTAWEMLGDGITGTFSDVYDMQVYKGKLYVSGSFSKYDRPQNPGNRIVAWNGSYWEQVGDIMGVNESSYGYVSDMAVFNNELYLVGNFNQVNGYAANNFAKFDGTDWCVYNDVFDSFIEEVEVYDGELYISGVFSSINGSPVNFLAKLLPTATPYNCHSVIGLEEISNFDFVVYPNPANEELNISEAKIGSNLDIRDLCGRVMLSTEIVSESQSVDISSVPSGIYTISVGEITKRFIVE